MKIRHDFRRDICLLQILIKHDPARIPFRVEQLFIDNSGRIAGGDIIIKLFVALCLRFIFGHKDIGQLAVL